MAVVRRVGTLELEQDLRFHWRQWQVSRLVWVALLAVMGATALGAFGNGPLARASAGTAGGPLWLEYDRIARFGASIRIVVHARPQPDGAVQITVGRSLLDALRLQHVTPAPLSTALVESGVMYRFPAANTATAVVIFEMQPATRWTVSGDIASPDGVVAVEQFILP